MATSETDRLSRREAAAYLKRQPSTLAVWAARGQGPRFININGRVEYTLGDLDEYRASSRRTGAV